MLFDEFWVSQLWQFTAKILWLKGEHTVGDDFLFVVGEGLERDMSTLMFDLLSN